MRTKHSVLAIDLGGTNLRAGAVGEDGSVEFRESRPAEAKRGHAQVLANLRDCVERITEAVERQGGEVAGVGLGIPGIVDPKNGIIYQSPHFPDWNQLDLRAFFGGELGESIVIDNDANMAARGEGWKGAGRGLKNFVMLTFGTGIGGGIVVDGKVLHGDSGFAGEVGHLVIETGGPGCPCGGRGCLEMYASATGILRLVEESDDRDGRERLLTGLGLAPDRSDRLTVAHLYEAARDGDIFCNVTFKKMGYYLGIGLASLVNTLGIETVIVGGGVAQAWDFFIEAAKKELAQRTYKETARRVRLLRAELGDDAGLIGAADSVFKSR